MIRSEQVLMVDDDANLLAACERHLRRHFTVRTAVGAQKGLEALAQQGPFGVVVSDMRMPGMDGVQFLAQVRERSPQTMRIMLTAFPDFQTAIDAVNEGQIYRFLTKPCPPEILIPAVEAALEQRRLEEGRLELLEMKLRQAQKMELVGQFAAGAFHEIRNILTIIELQAGMALMDEAINPKLSKALGQIQGAASNAARLTRRVVDFSRREEAPEFGPVDLSAFLAQVSEMLRQLLPKSVRVDSECASGIPPVCADAGALGQIVLNLALNARDAMPQGGTLRLRVQRAASPGQESLVELSVGDTGCGMDTVIRNRLFEPFFTTKQAGQGTGLGLAVVADIVKQHHGHLEVSSEPGQGSTFRVFLPASSNGIADMEPDMEPDMELLKAA